MKKILVLTSTFPRWNDDTEPPFVYELSRRLSKWYGVVVLAPHCKGAKVKETYLGLEVIRFRYFFEWAESLCYEGGIIAKLKQNPFRYFLVPFFFLFQTVAIYRLIKNLQLQAIHSHWIIPQTLSCILACSLAHEKPGLICTSHGGDLYSLKGAMLSRLKKWILNNMDCITVVNSKMKFELDELQVDTQRTEVVPMGVDVKNTFVAKDSEKKPFTLLFVGRLVEKKGITYLLDAMPDILRKYPQTTLTIVGEGPLEESLKSQVDYLNISEKVNFIGAIRNNLLPQYYQSHQLSVFPFVIGSSGDREGLPVVISEAMSCGCNIVTTNLPGIEDLVIHNSNGLIVSQNNSHELAEAVVYLFDNPQMAQKFSDAALKHVQSELDWDIIANKYRKIIERCNDAR